LSAAEPTSARVNWITRKLDHAYTARSALSTNCPISALPRHFDASWRRSAIHPMQKLKLKRYPSLVRVDSAARLAQDAPELTRGRIRNA